MNMSEPSENGIIASKEESPSQPESNELPRPQPPPILGQIEPESMPSEEPNVPAEDVRPKPDTKAGLDKNKVILLGGGLAAAVLFFAFTLMLGHSSHKGKVVTTHPQSPPEQQTSTQPPSGIAPIITPARQPVSTGSDGQLTVEDIERMRSPDSTHGANSPKPGTPPSGTPHTGDSLAGVPSFADTQQRWEEPRPYEENSNARSVNPQQEQAALKETSIVFVRSQTQTQGGSAAAPASSAPDLAFLDVTPGSRILAKLQTEISTADPTSVVAQVEYTYAIGDQVVLPAGAQIYGHVQQADQAGNVSVKFDEIELLDRRREKIAAVGKGLDMGPIKGKVYGKNTGKNLLVRSVSGIGSTLAMVFGNNTSSAYSQDDLIRERLAENIGTAGDSEVMSMALNSHEFVAVPAQTRIYVVFTEREESSSGLHKVTP
jgi:hypothetical protein